MESSTLLINQIIDVIDIVYILICNAATYFIITFSESINREKTLMTWHKRLLSAAVALLLGVLFVDVFHHGLEPIVVGFFLQFLAYDYLLKPAIKLVRTKINPSADDEDVDLDGTSNDTTGKS